MKRLSLVTALLAATSSLVLVNTAFGAEQVGSILLSSGGLAEIVKHVELGDNDKAISLEIPVDQADDVLKSLIVSDPAGTVATVTIDGANAVAQAFKHMPFKREDLASTATIAAAMTGYKATIDDGNGHVDLGVILGVTQIQRATTGEPIEVPAATVQHEDGSLAQVLLGPGASVTFADESVQKRIETAIAAVRQATDTNFRTIRIETTGSGKRTVDLSYVVAAPVWKAAYRIVPGTDGKYRVQGWAVLENGTGDDWNNVSVTLSSSNPVALKQRLLDMYWRDRREVPIMLPGGAINPIVDGSQGDAAGAMDQMGEADMPGLAAPAPMAMAEAAPMVGGMAAKTTAQRFTPQPSRGPEAISSEGDVGITFTLPQPVTLLAGQTLTVPIIDADFDADLVSMWQGGSAGDHPVEAIFLDNASGKSVPPGIFTVYGKEGYLGDAQVLGIPPGEKRFAAFAADPKTRVTSESTDDSTITGIKARDGLLTVTSTAIRKTVYHVTAPKDAGRTLLIDHMKLSGYDASTTAEVVSDEADRLRLRAKVEAGAKLDIPVTEKTVESQVVTVAESSADSLVYWASTKAIEPEIAAKLKAIAALKHKVDDYQRAVDEADQVVSRKTAEQERIRANLAALPETSDSAKSYIAKLDKSEAAIDAAQADRTKNQDLADKANQDLDDAIRAL
ncbi:DUF4139 domain-containing protein [Oryzibacter oryziterrae]|uniref:DUF4139 domain-containing protein n=1 Tax=Oryzibacter oryziterrae TaxID=2766474 RepID=UPI001F1A7860|nr:DUF4139 domain-containing protein [Oryzibacter oryziterrae]